MEEKQEEIADIIAEMRCGLDKSWHEIDREWARDLPDRLEAALKREKAATEADALAVGGIVEAARKGELSKTRPKNAADFGQFGNAAATREALEHVEKLAREFAAGNYYVSDFPKMLLDAIRTALAAPPRNCDLFGGNYKMLHTAWWDWTCSPSGTNPDGTVKLTFGEWLLKIVEVRHA